MKFKEYDDKTFLVKKIKREKVKDLNPNTNRIKTYKRTAYLKTDVPMEKRSFRNIPKYADGKNKVDWKDWLGIKGEKINSSHAVNSIGKSEVDGAWWGWSHRACYGFKVGDTVKAGSIGNDHEGSKDFVIDTEDQAKEMAIKYAKDVA